MLDMLLEPITGAPYLTRAFIMLMALGIVSGLVGVIVNLRALEFNAEACVHSIFPGVVAGALFGGIDAIIPWAAAVGAIVAIVLTAVHRKHPSEAGTAVVLTSFFSLGIVLSLKKGEMSGQLEALMFGRLLEISEPRLIQSLIVCAFAYAVIALSWNKQVFVAFDRQGASASGINVTLIDLLLNGAIAAVVVAASTAVGVLLVIGYLVIPGAAGRLVAGSIKTMATSAVLLGAIGGYIGMLALDIPTSHSISPQASVALSVVGLYFIMLAVSKAAPSAFASSATEGARS